MIPVPVWPSSDPQPARATGSHTSQAEASSAKDAEIFRLRKELLAARSKLQCLEKNVVVSINKKAPPDEAPEMAPLTTKL